MSAAKIFVPKIKIKTARVILPHVVIKICLRVKDVIQRLIPKKRSVNVQ